MQKKHLMVQLIDVLIRCHSRNIFHRDLKPENILLDKTRRQIYLSDFGLAVKRPLSHKPRDGTVEFMSPGIVELTLSSDFPKHFHLRVSRRARGSCLRAVHEWTL